MRKESERFCEEFNEIPIHLFSNCEVLPNLKEMHLEVCEVAEEARTGDIINYLRSSVTSPFVWIRKYELNKVMEPLRWNTLYIAVLFWSARGGESVAEIFV